MSDGRLIRIKAVTVAQPHAQLLAVSRKRIETKPKRTHYRGPLAIHAGLWPIKTEAKFSREFFIHVADALGVEEDRLLSHLDMLPRGAVIAIGELYDCFEIVDSTWRQLTRAELLFGDYRSGRWGWRMRNVELLDEPIAVAGKQGLWNVEIPEALLPAWCAR